MVYTKLVCFAILALSLLLSGAETREVEWPQSELSHRMCCKKQPEFGPCETKEDDRRCSEMCIRGCCTNKGGGCQPLDAPPGSVCQCYCLPPSSS